MNEPGAVTAVASAIQLSVAPVFLLSGIGGMLAVMANRLSRVVDRARQVDALLAQSKPNEAGGLYTELSHLKQRAHLINRAITMCTMTALLVCAVVGAMFVGAFFGFPVSGPVAGLFVAAMALFFVGLLYFLREIFVATATFRIGRR